MSTEPGDQRMSPESYYAAEEPPKQGHGCFFYGCITAIVLAVLMMVVIGISGYFGYQAYIKLVNQYTSPTPATLPKVEMSQEDRQALLGRIDAFEMALDEGKETEPLVLSGDELNVWLAEKTEFGDKVYVVVEGDKVKGEVSLPLGGLSLPGVKGRYLNGKGAFLVSLRDGDLDVRVDSMEVNGKPLPEQFVTGLGNQNLAEEAAKQPKNRRVLDKLESLQIKDGKVIIKAKPAKERGEESSSTKEDEPKPAEEPATKSDMEPAAKSDMEPAAKSDTEPAAKSDAEPAAAEPGKDGKPLENPAPTPAPAEKPAEQPEPKAESKAETP